MSPITREQGAVAIVLAACQIVSIAGARAALNFCTRRIIPYTQRTTKGYKNASLYPQVVDKEANRPRTTRNALTHFLEKTEQKIISHDLNLFWPALSRTPADAIFRDVGRKIATSFYQAIIFMIAAVYHPEFLWAFFSTVSTSVFYCEPGRIRNDLLAGALEEPRNRGGFNDRPWIILFLHVKGCLCKRRGGNARFVMGNDLVISRATQDIFFDWNMCIIFHPNNEFRS